MIPSSNQPPCFVSQDKARAAFQTVESLVFAVSSVSHMLESTYDALFSSVMCVTVGSPYRARDPSNPQNGPRAVLLLAWQNTLAT